MVPYEIQPGFITLIIKLVSTYQHAANTQIKIQYLTSVGTGFAVSVSLRMNRLIAVTLYFGVDEHSNRDVITPQENNLYITETGNNTGQGQKRCCAAAVSERNFVTCDQPVQP